MDGAASGAVDAAATVASDTGLRAGWKKGTSTEVPFFSFDLLRSAPPGKGKRMHSLLVLLGGALLVFVLLLLLLAWSSLDAGPPMG